MMMNELLKSVKENQHLKVVPMVDRDIVADDSYSYWQGSIGACFVDEIHNDGERVWFRKADNIELEEHFFNKICNERVIFKPEEELDEIARKRIAKLSWEKVIVLKIELP